MAPVDRPRHGISVTKKNTFVGLEVLAAANLDDRGSKRL
jgi:hypothetical protein